MSLPARQQRALNGIETALRASEPQMTAMFTMFTRLVHNDGPALPERLSGSRFRASARLRAFVLLPVVFAMLLTGALLGGGSVRGSNCGPRLAGFMQNETGRNIPSRTTCRRLTQPGGSAERGGSAKPASPVHRVGLRVPLRRLSTPAMTR